VARRPGWSTERQEIVDRLFVYGSLRRGQTARSLVAQHVSRWAPATTRGTLYAFPDGYPGLLEHGAGTVKGEVLWLTDLASTLPLLDAYEGDDFIRVLREVELEGATQWCWTYVLADERLVEGAEKVESGDWVRWQGGD
jgi:gamma-glutamylcyclotransferase (GGCT)/AIG2-like uncharacterized protein YtfP